jgi:hypothetical protein
VVTGLLVPLARRDRPLVRSLPITLTTTTHKIPGGAPFGVAASTLLASASALALSAASHLAHESTRLADDTSSTHPIASTHTIASTHATSLTNQITQGS